MGNAATKRKKWQPIFLKALAEKGLVLSACRTAKVCKTTVYNERKNDKAFKAEWEAALEASTYNLEDEAYRRATDGSDTMLIFLLKARNPAKYNDRLKIESATVNVNHSLDYTKLTINELKKLRELASKAETTLDTTS